MTTTFAPAPALTTLSAGQVVTTTSDRRPWSVGARQADIRPGDHLIVQGISNSEWIALVLNTRTGLRGWLMQDHTGLSTLRVVGQLNTEEVEED